jgi:hypothetical protein
MTGAGWIAFGVPGGPFNQLSAAKGIHILGSGPELIYRSVLPQVTVGVGYRTSIIGVNTGTGTIHAEVSLAKSDGTPFQATVDGQSANRADRTIAPLGTLHLTVTSTGAKATGFAKLQSGDALNGIALLQTLTGSTVVSEAGVRLSQSAKHFTVYVDNMNNARTGYTLTNFSTSGAQFDMTLRDKNGATLETAKVTLGQGPGLQLSEFASQRFPATAPAGFEGSIEFNSGSGAPVVSDGPGWYVGASSLRYDNSASDVVTAMPIVANEMATTFYYPHIADGGKYRTNFILLNPSTSATTATLEFFGDEGTPLSLSIGGVQRSTYSVPLPANGVDHFVTDGTAPEAKMGWVRVTSPVPIGGSAIFQRVVDGRIVSEAAVPPAPFAAHFTTHVDTRGSAQSGLAICNPNPFSVAATFNVRDSSGQIVASTTRTLEAFAHVAFLTDVRELEGTLEIQTNGAPLSGVGLRYDNPNGTVFTTMPVITIPSSLRES